MVVLRSSQLFGVGLLIFVNIVWVAASEITRYLFIDLAFKRPFFFTYAKSCMLSLFLLRYACACSGNPKTTSRKSAKGFYKRLNDYEDSGEDEEGSDEEKDYIETTLTQAEFEPISATDVESNTGEPITSEGSQANMQLELHPPLQQEQHHREKKRRVRFNKLREVRSWPEKLQDAAKMARLPYRQESGELCRDCSSLLSAQKSALFNYSVYFAPLWLIGSVSYQTALAYSSVSSVNLISASSPLFVLLFGACFGCHSPMDSFNWSKLAMVLINFGGVCIVSKFSDSWIGSATSLFSAFSNALYLFALSRISVKEEHVDMPLMLGVIGLFSLIVCTPLMIILHGTGIEPQLPLPTLRQMAVLIANAFLGTLFADSLWLYATLLTGSLTSALSGSLGIPLSMLADSFFRNQPPNIWQMVASIPIMISFIGASYHTATSHTPHIHLPPDTCSSDSSSTTSTIIAETPSPDHHLLSSHRSPSPSSSHSSVHSCQI